MDANETIGTLRDMTPEERQAKDIDFHLSIARKWAADPFKQELDSERVIRDAVIVVENLIDIVATLRAVISVGYHGNQPLSEASPSGSGQF